MQQEWQEINPMNNRMWDIEKQNKIQGIYIGKQDDIGPNHATMHTVRIDTDRIDTGENIGIWGNILLNSKLQEIKIGEEVLIEFTGMVKSTKRSGAEYKNYKVFKRPVLFQEVDGNNIQEEEIPVIDADNNY